MYKLLWLAGIPLGLLILAMITGFQPLYWLLYLVLGGTVIGYLWAWLQSRGLEVQVQGLAPHPQVGQTVNIQVMVREKAGLPRIGLRARLVGDFAAMAEEDFGLAPRGRATWTVSGLCRRRGPHSIGSLAIVTNDPSGLVHLECRVGQPQNILVYPAALELPRALVQGQASGGELGEAGQLVGHSPSVSMVRQYVPGDNLTRIHWPTTARLGQLMTKEFEVAGINEIWLFLDLQETVQAGTEDESTEEYSITIAASLAKRLIQDGHAVGMVAHGDEIYRFAPRKEPDHIWALLKALALVRAKGRTALQTLLAQESGNLGPGTVAMVIAPWSSRSIESLFQFLTRRGIMVVPIFLDSASFAGLPDSRWLANTRLDMQELTTVVRQGDDLSASLGNVLDRIASY